MINNKIKKLLENYNYDTIPVRNKQLMFGCSRYLFFKDIELENCNLDGKEFANNNIKKTKIIKELDIKPVIENVSKKEFSKSLKINKKLLVDFIQSLEDDEVTLSISDKLGFISDTKTNILFAGFSFFDGTDIKDYILKLLKDFEK